LRLHYDAGDCPHANSYGYTYRLAYADAYTYRLAYADPCVYAYSNADS
jgi:hypothetical protein